MRWMAIVLLVAFGGAAQAEEAAPTGLEIGALSTAEVLLAIDLLQTLKIKRYPVTPRGGLHETNPLLGRHPGDPAIVAYFSASMLATAAVWYFVPPLRLIFPAIVVGVEIPPIYGNVVRMGFSF